MVQEPTELSELSVLLETRSKALEEACQERDALRTQYHELSRRFHALNQVHQIVLQKLYGKRGERMDDREIARLQARLFEEACRAVESEQQQEAAEPPEHTPPRSARRRSRKARMQDLPRRRNTIELPLSSACARAATSRWSRSVPRSPRSSSMCPRACSCSSTRA
ncbi:MAG TPA: hypothetical protein VEB21_03345 [Terriglobales bacterium]|nr:hypothetical protein [Terriglobales bacterium]